MKRISAPEQTREQLRALIEGRLGTAPDQSSLVLPAARLTPLNAGAASDSRNLGFVRSPPFERSSTPNTKQNSPPQVDHPTRGFPADLHLDLDQTGLFAHESRILPSALKIIINRRHANENTTNTCDPIGNRW